MSLHTVGLNHTTAPLEVRERVTFAPDALADALRDITGARTVKEAAILSTCNRTEVYFHGGEPARVAHWLEDVHGLKADTLRPHLYTLGQDQAVTHAFRVASGLDSMVLGEPQILGQMKQAVRTAESAGSLGLVLPSIADQRLLLIGAGEMIELAANHFVARRPKSVTVANRTFERGQSLADRLGAEAILLNELAERLPQFDMIVTCTASTLPILGKGLLERVIRARRHAPVFIVDLAVPRDVEPEAGALDDVFLYSVDDLSAIVKDNLQIRKEAVVQAEAMIAEQTAHFLHWLEGRSVVPTIHALSGHVDELRELELERARRLLANGTEPERVLEALARGLSNKFLHAPLSALNTAGDAERAELIALFQRVYRLHEPPVDGSTGG